jgi:hypothetical protein
MTAPLHTRVIGRRLLLTGHFADPVDITQADDLGDGGRCLRTHGGQHLD